MAVNTRLKILTILSTIFLLGFIQESLGQIYINEFLASNVTTNPDNHDFQKAPTLDYQFVTQEQVYGRRINLFLLPDRYILENEPLEFYGPSISENTKLGSNKA